MRREGRVNLEDLAKIEQTVGFRLADDLRELYLGYPFQAGSWAAEFAMPNDVSYVLTLNGSDRISDSPPLSGRKVLQIGCDGGESLYFAEIVDQKTRVLEFELESGAANSRWVDLEAWVAELVRAQREVDEEEARTKNRPWWKFWE